MSENQQNPDAPDAATEGSEPKSDMDLMSPQDQPESLKHLPDLGAVLADPIYQQLELFIELFPPLESPGGLKKRDPKVLSNETIIAATKGDALGLAVLTEFLRRVRKGKIPLNALRTTYSEQDVRDQIMACFNYRMEDSYIPEDELENIIKGLVEGKVISAAEIVHKSLHPKLTFAVRNLYSISGEMLMAIMRQKTSVVPTSTGSSIEQGFPLKEAGTATSHLQDLIHQEKGIEMNVPKDKPSASKMLTAVLSVEMKHPIPVTEFESGATELDPSELIDDEGSIPRMQVSKPPLPPPSRKTEAHEEAESLDHVMFPVIYKYDESGKELVNGSHPLFCDKEIFTMGTNISNDMVIGEDPDGRIAPLHAELKIENGEIFIRGRSDGGGPLKVVKRGGRQIVSRSWRQIDEEQTFIVGHIHDRNENGLPRLAIKLDQLIEKKQLSEYLRERVTTLIREHANKILSLLIRKNDKSKPGHEEIKKDSETDAEILAIESMYKQILLDGIKYKLELFRPAELADVINTERGQIYEWMQTRMYAMIQNYGQKLLEKIESQRNKVTKTGKPEDLDIALGLPAEFHKIYGMGIKYGIDVMTDEEIQQRLDQATARATEAIKDIRSSAMARLDEEAARVKEEKQRALQPILDHENSLKEYKRQYTGVHFMNGMEKLDSNTKFTYVGPVIRILDNHEFKETVPFLLNRITLGEHPTNTIELPKVVDRKRGTKPFMVEIERDQKTEAFLMHWKDGNVEFSSKETPITPTFEIPFSRPVRIGRYTIMIEDRHAYTEEAIKGIAGQQGEELLEIIFDQWFASQDRTEEAYEQLKELVYKKYVDRQAVNKGLSIRMIKLWEEIGTWRSDLPLRPKTDSDKNNLTSGSRCIQDAQFLITLDYLLADQGQLTEKILHQHRVKDAAKIRANAFIDAYNEAVKEESFSLGSIVFNMKKSLMPKSADVLNNERRRAVAMERAEIGKIQIARFLAAGLVAEEDIKDTPNLSPGYLLIIQEVSTIRNLFERFRKGGEGVDVIDELEHLCEGKKMKDVFSTDEILIANLNIELNVNEEYPLKEYLRHLAGFIARESFREAMTKVDNAKELATIKKLLDLNSIKIIDLSIPPLITPELIQAQLDELFQNADHAKKQAERERQLKIRKYEILQREAVQKDAKRHELAEKADKVRNALELARVETKLEVLLEVAEILADKEVDDEMEEEKISLQSFRYQPRQRRGDPPNLLEAVVAERRTVTWRDMKNEYSKLTLKAAKKTAEKIIKGEDASRNHTLLMKAAEKNIVDLNALELDNQKIQTGLEIEMANQKRSGLEKKYAAQLEQFFKAPFDDLSYLDAIDQNAITDEDERKYVKGLIALVSNDRMDIVQQNLWNGKDIIYMKLIAKKLMRKGFDANRYYTESDPALSQ